MHTLECPKCQCHVQYAGQLGYHFNTKCTNCGDFFDVDYAVFVVGPPAASPFTIPTYAIECPNCHNQRDYKPGISVPPFTCPPCGFSGDISLWVLRQLPPAAQIKRVSKEELKAKFPSRSTCAAPTCEIVHVELMNCEYDYCRTHKIEVDKDAPPSYL